MIRCDVEIVLLANHVKVHNGQRTALLTDEYELEFDQLWQKYRNEPMVGRNLILKSFCPKIYGMYIVKLAIMMVLMGGVAKYDQSGVKVRGDSHILLVGDPGIASRVIITFISLKEPVKVNSSDMQRTFRLVVSSLLVLVQQQPD